MAVTNYVGIDFKDGSLFDNNDGTPTGKDPILGTDKGDFIPGDFGNDIIDGLGGTDNIYGNIGNDTLYGGEDDDTLWGDNDPKFNNFDGLSDDLLKGGKGNDVLNGGLGNDTLKGNRGADVLNGDVGNDMLKGGGGKDVLNGGRGDDVLTGGRGKDTYVFTSGFGDDVITDFKAQGADQIDLSAFELSGITDPDLNIGDNGVDTTITIDGFSGSIKLLGVDDANDLTSDDFIF